MHNRDHLPTYNVEFTTAPDRHHSLTISTSSKNDSQPASSSTSTQNKQLGKTA